MWQYFSKIISGWGLCFLILFSCLQVVGQSLPDAPDKFIDRFIVLLKNELNNKDERDSIIENLELIWQDTTFSFYQKPFISTCKLLLKGRLNADPDVKTYTNLLVYFYHFKALPAYKQLNKMIAYVLKKEGINKTHRFLKNIQNLFLDSMLYKTRGHYYKYLDGAPQFSKKTSELAFLFKDIKILLVEKEDSSLIESTSGKLLPMLENWTGNGGKVYWARNGLPRNKVFAELASYSINLKRSSYTADSVLFTNKKFFDKPLLGSFEEKLVALPEGARPSFPKFNSYAQKIVINDILPGADYVGGFAFRGNRFIAKGVGGLPATIKFYRNNTLFLKIKSSSFSVSEEKAAAQNASVTIFLGDKDSITHQNVTFKYLADKKEVNILRIGDGMSRSPFIDTYHNLDLYFEALYWQLDKPLLEISMTKGSAKSSAKFRSVNFFSMEEFRRLRGLDRVHPLFVIEKFINTKKDSARQFKALELAQYMHLSLDQTQIMLINFSIAGLMTFYTKTDRATVNDRFFHTIKSRRRTSDYDVIEFQSIINGTNAEISLLDYSLDMNGVGQIFVSNAQDVTLYPKNQEISVKKEMNFKFDGLIDAGRFTFYGRSFDFVYDDFNIEMDEIDSFRVKVPAFVPNVYGQRPLRSIETVIEDLRGELQIDHPKNKSGMKQFPIYPTFTSEEPSFAYYDNASIEGGVYNRNDFYFKVDPFEIDSLDNFKTENFKLPGEFFSADIFPTFREELTIMKDYSFGFTRDVGENYPAYGGVGKFSDTITLSNNGLRGNGKLDYLNTAVHSNAIKFYPDSVNAFAHYYKGEKSNANPKSPKIEGTRINIHWLPYQNVFTANTTDVPLQLYDSAAKLMGSLNLTTTGTQASGIINFKRATIVSESFNLEPTNLKADTSNFYLSANEENDTANAFEMRNVRANINFIARKGIFKSNSKESIIKFPKNSFQASLDSVVWDMENDELNLDNNQRNPQLGLSGAVFVATNPELDSLSFVSPNAIYDIKTNSIICKGVKYIDIADARIFPKDSTVIIRDKAFVDTLFNATINIGKDTADSALHVLTNATVLIQTGNQYIASAQYEYLDELGTSQKIFFDSVYVGADLITRAKGIIKPTIDFSISPNFAFKGTIALKGDKKLLNFDGYTKITHNCTHMENQWIKFKTDIDPFKILIPVTEKPENDRGKPLFNGFLFASDSSGIYPAIFTPKKRTTDYVMLAAQGYLYFDKSTSTYKVGSKEKIFNPTLTGQFLQFNSKTCNSYGEGKISLGADFGQVGMDASGKVYHLIAEDSAYLDLLVTFEFKLDEDLMNFMYEKLTNNASLDYTFTSDKNKRFIYELLKDSSKANQFITSHQTETIDKIKVPDKLDKTLVIYDLKPGWNAEEKALQYKGSIGLPIINGKVANVRPDILFELDRTPGGDRLTMFIYVDDYCWFFFFYRNNSLQLYSSYDNFNKGIDAIEPDKRMFEEKGQQLYRYYSGSRRRVDRFREKFNFDDD